jgi:hypothetical protein
MKKPTHDTFASCPPKNLVQFQIKNKALSAHQYCLFPQADFQTSAGSSIGTPDMSAIDFKMSRERPLPLDGPTARAHSDSTDAYHEGEGGDLVVM